VTRGRRASRAAALALLLAAAACATNPPVAPPANVPPKFPEFERPDPPPELQAPPEVRDLHQLGWRRLQAGDLRGAERDFATVLKRAPEFYPAHAGLGYADLAEREAADAATDFEAALRTNPRYLPALLGLADAQLALEDLAAVATMERILEVDPARDAIRTRLDLLRFRQVQSLIEDGRRAREANRLEESQSLLERALTLSPSSAVILRELALVELRRDALEAADAHARRAVALDPFDAETHAALGLVLEARGDVAGAAASYSRAAAIDSRYRERVERLRGRLAVDATPEELKALPTAPTVTRGTLAALIGTRLEPVIAGAPVRATTVATDVGGHWAAAWIVRVTQAGVMEISPNHTFQPAATVRRGDLARVVAQLVGLAAANRSELGRWRAARPRFTDLPPSNLFYASAAIAVASGAMAAGGDRFEPLRPATGAEVIAAIARVEQLAR
jgi:tetratricopeptide (TPR) repeat protein